MFKIVASDLDGTLLNTQHKLSPYTKETLRDLKTKGIHFIFATGRHHLDVIEMRNSLGIEAYMITSNGARIHDKQGNLFYKQDIEPDIVLKLTDFIADKKNITPHLYKDDGWLCDRPLDDYEVFFQESNFNYQLFDPQHYDSTGVAKLFYTAATHEELLPLETQLKNQWGNQINITFSSLDCLEVMASGVSKGQALDVVSKQLGYNLLDCIAFGDGMNDVEMLSMVGKGCIMQNAPQRLKNSLPHIEIIGKNADDAVPHFLNQFYQP